jgi:hypothetical protein
VRGRNDDAVVHALFRFIRAKKVYCVLQKMNFPLKSRSVFEFGDVKFLHTQSDTVNCYCYWCVTVLNKSRV